MSDTAVLYLRGMSRALVREAKVAAAQQGVTLTRLVARALETVLASPAHAPEDGLDREMRWYEQNRARLVRKYDGQYVAIRDQAIVDHDKRFDAIAQRVFEKYGPHPIFIPLVAATDRVYRVRSPRLVRK